MIQPSMTYKNIFTFLVQELNQLLKEAVIITNEEGIIVASTESERIGEFHEGAKLAMERKQLLNMTDQLAEQLEGVRKGVVLPIMIHDVPIAVLGITGEPQQIESQALLVKRVAELFIQDTIQQMDREKRERDLEYFVFDWLHDNTPKSTLSEKAAFLKLDMSLYCRVIVCMVPESNFRLSSQHIRDFRTLWNQPGSTCIVRWGQHKWVLLTEKVSDNLLKQHMDRFRQAIYQQYGVHVFAGCGQTVSPAELPQSLEQAEQAAAIAHSHTPVIFERDLGLEMFLSELDEGIKHKFIERSIGMLDATLLHTLGEWFNNDMSSIKAAEALHIHKNTLYYRLKRIEAITGLAIDQAQGFVELYLGYVLMKE